MGGTRGDGLPTAGPAGVPVADAAPVPAQGRTERTERTPNRAQTTRQALLRAALEVFGEEGYAAAGIAEVVRRADASVGGLYHHFDGKVELFLALWEDFRTAQAHAAAQAVSGLRKAGETEPRTLFLAGTRAYLEHTWARREVAKLFYLGDTPPGFDLLGRQNSQEWMRHNAMLLGTHERPSERALLVVLTTAIAEIGRELVTCDDPREAVELTGTAVELIGGLCDFAPALGRQPGTG